MFNELIANDMSCIVMSQPRSLAKLGEDFSTVSLQFSVLIECLIEQLKKKNFFKKKKKQKNECFDDRRDISMSGVCTHICSHSTESRLNSQNHAEFRLQCDPSILQDVLKTFEIQVMKGQQYERWLYRCCYLSHTAQISAG